jgi:chemotaxis protein MotA
MDIMSLTGIVLAFVSIIVGSILKGSGVKALLGAAAFMIVVVGTLAAILVQTPLPVFKRAMKICRLGVQAAGAAGPRRED